MSGFLIFASSLIAGFLMGMIIGILWLARLWASQNIKAAEERRILINTTWYRLEKVEDLEYGPRIQ